MNIAIISDTHDNVAAVEEIIELLNERNIDLAFHAGDLIHPGIIKLFNEHFHGTLHFVLGNNDGEKVGLAQIAVSSEKLVCHNREMELEVAGKRIYMNHYSDIADAFAQLGKFDLCIGGHDHQQREIKYGKCLFINPGHTLVNSRKKVNSSKPSPHTFVVLDLETMQSEVVELQTA